MLRADITNYCNIRCKFCGQGGKGPKPANMNTETFKKVLSLLDLTVERGYFFSCFYEPTIHPKFAEMLTSIPPEQKSKGFLTTNLARPLNKQALQALAGANLHNINISIQTLDENLADFLSGSKNILANIFNNLDQLMTLPDIRPKIHFITMMLKDTIPGLPDLLTTIHKRYSPDLHEVRTPFRGDDWELKDAQWSAKQLLTPEEFASTKSKLEELDLPLRILDYSNPPPPEPDSKKNTEPVYFFDIRILVNGDLLINNQPYFNINEHNDCKKYLIDIFNELNSNTA